MSYNVIKIDNLVKSPIENLCLDKYVLSADKEKRLIYYLIAVTLQSLWRDQRRPLD